MHLKKLKILYERKGLFIDNVSDDLIVEMFVGMNADLSYPGPISSTFKETPILATRDDNLPYFFT